MYLTFDSIDIERASGLQKDRTLLYLAPSRYARGVMPVTDLNIFEKWL
jgi:hypothetical protein